MIMSQPPGIEAPVSPSSVQPIEHRSATIELPILPTGPVSSNMSPAKLRSLAPIARAQAPGPDVDPAIIAALRTACTGAATSIELSPHGSNGLSIRLALAPWAKADVLAERIAQLPSLTGYQIEMDFGR